MKEKIIGFLKIIRIELCLFATIGLFVSAILANNFIGYTFEFLLGFLIVFLTAAGAFAVNDYFDFDIDKANERKDRPLAQGILSRKSALITSIVLLIVAVILSLFLNLPSMILALVSITLFYGYSMGLKKVIFAKNLLIAYSYAGTILFGSLVADAFLEPIIIYFAIMGFIVGLGSEIMFDIADVYGDETSGVITIPSKFGLKTAAIISVTLYIIIIIMDPLPFFILIDSRLYLNLLFLILILIPVIGYIFLSISLIRNQSKENTLKLRKLIFVIMQIGTIAYLIGVLLPIRLF